MILLFCPRKWRVKLQQSPPLEQLIGYGSWLLFTCVLLVFLQAYFEKTGLGEAAWQMWQTVTTIGYGNKPAESVGGRLVVVILGTLGIAFLGVTIGAALELNSYRQNQRRKGIMNNPGKNGYVVFHYPGKTRFSKFIQEVRQVELDTPICLVDSELDSIPPELEELPNTHFVRGNPIDKKTYERADIAHAKRVIVFPNKANDPSSDAATRTTTELICRHIGEDCRVVHVLVDPANAWLFEGLPSTPVAESLSILALVQECQDVHSAAVFGHILSNANPENARTVQIGQALSGLSWINFQKGCLSVAEALGVGVNPIALIRNKQVHACPKGSERLQTGDCISLVASGSFDWTEFEHSIPEAARNGNGAYR